MQVNACFVLGTKISARALSDPEVMAAYSVTPRRRRQQLARQPVTVPNQLQQATERPTLRWVVQRLEGIHRVRVTVQGELHDLIDGLNEVTRQILRLFGERGCHLDQIAPG
jgi:hypothetical protein